MKFRELSAFLFHTHQGFYFTLVLTSLICCFAYLFEISFGPRKIGNRLLNPKTSSASEMEAPPQYTAQAVKGEALQDWLRGIDCGVYTKRFAGKFACTHQTATQGMSRTHLPVPTMSKEAVFSFYRRRVV